MEWAKRVTLMACCCSVAFAHPVAAQTPAAGNPDPCHIVGRVLDSAGGILPGASVSVPASNLTTTATEQGRFCLEGLPTGSHVVVVALDGFATRRITVRTEVVTNDLMTRSGARTLADAVEYTTGVRVENNCQNCNFSQIRLLGLDGPYTQILVDGQPIVSSLAQVYGIEQIPARMIERIEVVKGGGSALYGPGSVGGVVNIIPREPPRSGGLAEIRADSFGEEANLSFNGALDWV